MKQEIKGLFTHIQKEKISKEQLAPLLYGLLKNITLQEFAYLITNKFTCCIEYAQLINGENINSTMSFLFNPHRLDTSTKKSKITIYQSLKKKDKIKGLARVALHKGINSKRGLLNIIEIGFNGVTYVQDFLSYVARDLCKKYNLNKNSKILDPCGGWGGRMIGISVVCNYYEAFEPCTKTSEGLKQLSIFLQSFNKNFTTKIHTLPFEDSKLKKNYYDFALTSPPYYDTEIYSKEESNSLNRYSTFEEWCEGFYYPLISKTMTSLKKKGVFILNIGNRRYPLADILIKEFKNTYNIKRIKNHIYNAGSLGRKYDKGESFYQITNK